MSWNTRSSDAGYLIPLCLPFPEDNRSSSVHVPIIGSKARSTRSPTMSTFGVASPERRSATTCTPTPSRLGKRVASCCGGCEKTDAYTLRSASEKKCGAVHDEMRGHVDPEVTAPE